MCACGSSHIGHNLSVQYPRYSEDCALLLFVDHLSRVEHGFFTNHIYFGEYMISSPRYETSPFSRSESCVRCVLFPDRPWCMEGD